MSLINIRRGIRHIPFLSEPLRFLYFSCREVLRPIISYRLLYKHAEFELIDGLRFYFFWRAAVRQGSYSQCGQDLLVLGLAGDKKRGVFVDVGCNHPTLINNTAYLEREKGWHGLSIDAQSNFAAMYEEERSSSFLPCCVGADVGQVTFGVVCDGAGNVLSGVYDQLPRANVRGHDVDMQRLVQRPLGSILDECGIQEIDCLFIDVEGYELEVLRGIQFSRVSIAIIVLENARGISGDNRIRAFLNERGYCLRMRVRSDDIFVKSTPPLESATY